MAKIIDSFVKNNISNPIKSVIENGDLINRSIGERNSYDSITTVLRGLGHKPVSLMGSNYTYIFDHVRRVHNNKRFTFYGDKPTVRFVDVDRDVENLKDWVKSFSATSTNSHETTTYYSESEDDVNQNRAIVSTQVNAGTWHSGLVESFNGRSNKLSQNELLKKTNDNFTAGKYRTLIARFHTNSEDSKDDSNPLQTAISNRYGMSHGRNLLKVSPTNSYGYDNPYCRVWTYHHQYHTLIDAIRPFVDDNDAEGTSKIKQSDLERDYNWGAFRSPSVNTDNDAKGKFGTGGERLDKYGTLNRLNGLPNIAPIVSVSDYKNGVQGADDRVRIEQCMFSIENLAWKDTFKLDEIRRFEDNGLSPEQKGPFGGRIMWFPPYNIKFSESVDVDWGEAEFIGRGEKIYTYKNTERSGSLSFTMLIDHPSIIDYWEHGLKGDGNKTEDASKSGVDNIDSHEQQMLRFFAGCDVLKAGKFREPELEEGPFTGDGGKNGPNKLTGETDTPPSPEDKKLYCLIYYPNNYSGISDAPGSGSVVNAYDYLINGLGTQMFKTKNENNPNRPFDVLPSDVAVDVLSEYGVGYEMNKPRKAGVNAGNSTGISIFSNNISPRTPQNFKNSEDMLFNTASYKTSVNDSPEAFIDYKVSGDDNTYYAAMEVLSNSKANKVKWSDKEFGIDGNVLSAKIAKAQNTISVDMSDFPLDETSDYTVELNGNERYTFKLTKDKSDNRLSYYDGDKSFTDADFYVKVGKGNKLHIFSSKVIQSGVISVKGLRHEFTQSELTTNESSHKPAGYVNMSRLTSAERFTIGCNGEKYEDITIKTDSNGQKILMTPNRKAIIMYDNNKVYYVNGETLNDLTITPVKGKKGDAKSVYEWQHRRWWYRVDKTDDVINQRLVDLETGVSMWDNYVDKKSHALNSVGYKKTSEAGLFNLTEKDSIVSFADMYVGLHNDDKISEFYKDCVDQEGLTKVKDLLNGKYIITEIEYRGHASIHGDNKDNAINIERNTKLATQRADTAKAWFSSFKTPFQSLAKAGPNKTQENIQTTAKQTANTDVDDLLIKQWRSAAIIIHYKEAAVVDGQDSMNTVPKELLEKPKISFDNIEDKPWTILGKKDDDGNITGYTCNDVFVMRCGSHYWTNNPSRPKDGFKRISVDMWLNNESVRAELLKLYNNKAQGCDGEIDGFSEENLKLIRGWIMDCYRTENLKSNNNTSSVFKKDDKKVATNDISTIPFEVNSDESFINAMAYKYYNDYDYYGGDSSSRPSVFTFDDVKNWGRDNSDEIEDEYQNKYSYKESSFIEVVSTLYKTNGNTSMMTGDKLIDDIMKDLYLNKENGIGLSKTYSYSEIKDFANKYCSFPNSYSKVKREFSKAVGLSGLLAYSKKTNDIGDDYKYAESAGHIYTDLVNGEGSISLNKKYDKETIKAVTKIYQNCINAVPCGGDEILSLLNEAVSVSENPKLHDNNALGKDDVIITSIDEIAYKMTDDECKTNVMSFVNKGSITPDQAWKMYQECLKNKEEENGGIKKENGEKRNYPRYDNEGEFFKLLKLNDPTLHHMVTEKVKYFDPAFHSISPEGFNARLTFLHQCTRQGATIGSGDINQQGRTANNLAFGRPPVCILRIGDFYYTKIAIRSISIEYDPLVWDLNQEGIGTMPMFADINIQFKFLGGHGLSGPISRLQNAVSFNYYANTEVYDNRAEQAEFSNGKMTYFKPFEVNYSLPPTEKQPLTDVNDQRASQSDKLSDIANAVKESVNNKQPSINTSNSESKPKTGSGVKNKIASKVKKSVSSNKNTKNVETTKQKPASTNVSKPQRVICKYIRFGISRIDPEGKMVVESNDMKDPILFKNFAGHDYSLAELQNKRPDSFMFVAYIYYYDKKTKQVVDAKYWASRLRKQHRYAPEGVVEWYAYGDKPITFLGGTTPPLDDVGQYKFNNYKFVSEKETRQTVSNEIIKQNVYIDDTGRGRIYIKR